MTHDARARTEISLGLHYADVDADRCNGIANGILIALSSAGLRVVSAEPSEADVERVAVFARLAKARAYAKIDHRPITPHEEDEMWRTTARAAIAAFLAQGGGDA